MTRMGKGSLLLALIRHVIRDSRAPAVIEFLLTRAFTRPLLHLALVR